METRNHIYGLHYISIGHSRKDRRDERQSGRKPHAGSHTAKGGPVASREPVELRPFLSCKMQPLAHQVTSLRAGTCGPALVAWLLGALHINLHLGERGREEGREGRRERRQNVNGN